MMVERGFSDDGMAGVEWVVCVGWGGVERSTKVNPKVSGLAAWSENCKRYSSVPLAAVVSLFC